jgi:hypothetical protein
MDVSRSVAQSLTEQSLFAANKGKQIPTTAADADDSDRDDETPEPAAPTTVGKRLKKPHVRPRAPSAPPLPALEDIAKPTPLPAATNVADTPTPKPSTPATPAATASVDFSAKIAKAPAAPSLTPVNELDIDALKYAPSSFPIAMMACNRLKMIQRSLPSLLAVQGITHEQVTVYVDGNDQEVADFVREYPKGTLPSTSLLSSRSSTDQTSTI